MTPTTPTHVLEAVLERRERERGREGVETEGTRGESLREWVKEREWCGVVLQKVRIIQEASCHTAQQLTPGDRDSKLRLFLFVYLLHPHIVGPAFRKSDRESANFEHHDVSHALSRAQGAPMLRSFYKPAIFKSATGRNQSSRSHHVSNGLSRTREHRSWSRSIDLHLSNRGQGESIEQP